MFPGEKRKSFRCLFFLFLFFYCCAGWSTLWHLQKFFNITNVSYLNLPPSSSSFIPSHPHSWSSFNRYHFSHLHICVHSICTTFTLPHPFPTSSPLPLIPTFPSSPHRTCSNLLVSDFVKEEKNYIFVGLRF
jgi:hypothetical protein